MKRILISLCLAASLVSGNVPLVYAGGALEQIDITENLPSPIPGHTIAKITGIKWDARSIPVNYSMNTSLDPVPNPIGAGFISIAQAEAGLQASFDQWNDIPTSFIDMQINGTTTKTTLAGFDMINELTFRTATTFAAIASSPSTSLIRDITLVNGDLLDNDADPDVSSAITVAADVDGDGDIEFPAGFYKAGTILDNDVQFNTKTTNGLRFTLGRSSLDTDGRSVDLNTVATHEFGHSHGLSHSMDNQISAIDGSGTTMFPFIDTGDPDDEFAQASPAQDDISWSSFFYQEGTAPSGPAALQSGDKAFRSEFGLIRGELRHGVLNQPIAGGSVYATNSVTGEVIGSGFSGTTQFSRSPTGQLFFVDPAFNIQDGKYVIPVPRGTYTVGIEPVDGTPAAAANISLTCQVGGFFAQLNFVEEFWNGASESAVERRIGERTVIPVNPGRTQLGINFITSDVVNISNFGNRNFIGFTASPAGRMYAVQIPASQIGSINPGQNVSIQGVAFDTSLIDSSVPTVFAKAVLANGVVNPDNSITIDTAKPLESASGFLAQENDFSTFYFNDPDQLGLKLRDGIAGGRIENVFIVLQIPTTLPFAGAAGQAPVIGLDGGVANNDSPIFGRSFTSDNGGLTWTRTNTFNFRFSMLVSQPAAP